jgi:hypothetical protein
VPKLVSAGIQVRIATTVESIADTELDRLCAPHRELGVPGTYSPPSFGNVSAIFCGSVGNAPRGDRLHADDLPLVRPGSRFTWTISSRGRCGCRAEITANSRCVVEGRW